MAEPHVLEELADELEEYINAMAEYLAEEMASGGRAPFSAEASEDEKADYYIEEMYPVMFGPDGSRIETEHDAVIEQMGVDGYAALMRLFAQRGLPIGPGAPAVPVVTGG